MGFNPLAWITIGFAASSAVLVIWFLLRRPLLTRSTKIILLFGIGLLPLGTAMTGNYAGFEATKQRSFCGSCHVMTPYANDSGDPKSETLAARHGRNGMFGDENCYTCHADYGMFGTVKTKLGGLRHVYEYVLHYHDMPLEEAKRTIHIRQPFKNETCMHCHSTQNPGWNAVAEHKSILEPVRTGAVSCASEGCHGPAHPFTKNLSANDPSTKDLTVKGHTP
ncbi:MAG TPA: NapC/NirT family cytochrome c [Kofleriaceae bacterium]|nr:NapC/NirT family cytochrome c [Kofleriaceae bacterium]